MSQSFELTKEGIKLSYLRFLSDSAGGFVLLVLLGLAYSRGLPLPLLGDSWLDMIPKEPKELSTGFRTEFRVFFLVLTFLIATPLGLMLNGISFFLLGTLSARFVSFWEQRGQSSWLSFLIDRTRKKYRAQDTASFFRLRFALASPMKSCESNNRGCLFEE